MLWILVLLVLAGTRYWLSCNRKKLTILSLVFLTNFLFWSTIMMDPSSILASLRSTFFQMYKPNGSKTLNGFPLTTGFRSLSLPSLRQWRHDVWPWSCALLSVITTARQVLFFTGSISVSQDIVNELNADKCSPGNRWRSRQKNLHRVIAHWLHWLIGQKMCHVLFHRCCTLPLAQNLFPPMVA